MHTGQPCSLPNALISSGPWANSVVPGTTGAPPRMAARRLETLSDISSIADAGGPMNSTPISAIARAKSAFSEKNP